MSERLGSMTFGRKQEEVFLGRDLASHRDYSEEVASAIDKEIKEIIDSCYNRAETLLKENIDKLHRVAEVLLEKEKLDSEQFQEVFSSV